MRELRAMGAANALRARRKVPLRRATLLRALPTIRSASGCRTAACLPLSRSSR